MAGSTTLDQESLFSLEVVVDTLRLDSNIGCRFPAVAFRLLDFPTLLVYHVEPDLGERIKNKIKADPLYKVPNQLSELHDRHGSFVVKKGKSCLFKVTANTLRAHLQTMPLYVMIVDTYPDVPKLVASCTVPLDACIDEVYNDIHNLGLSVPSAHGIKSDFIICNLMGREVGKIVLGVRLLSLGVGLLQHIPESSIARIKKKAEITVNKQSKDVDVVDKPERITLYDLETLDKPVQVCINPEPIPVEDFQAQTERNILSNTGTQTLEKKKKKSHHWAELVSPKVYDEIDDFFVTNTECPPPLFFNSEMEKPTSRSLLLSYYPVGLPAKADGYTESDSDDETIRSEDRFSDSDMEVDSSQLVKPVKKQFNPKTITQPKIAPPQQIQGSIAQLPILNALIQEISSLTGGQLVEQRTDTVRKLLQRSPRSSSPTTRVQPSKPSRPVSPVHKKTDISKVLQKDHSSRTTSPRHPPPGRALPRTSSPTTLHKHVCQDTKAEVTSAKLSTKSKGWIQHPHSAGVPKTKLQPGMTNTQRLRLAKINPRLLETLEKAEQERVQLRRQQLQKKRGSQQFTNSTDLADVSTEIRHHPMKERAEFSLPDLDLGSSVESRYHKKPVPTPRLSMNKESESAMDEDVIPVTPRPRKSKQHIQSEDDTRSEQPDQTCHSEQQSSKIEVYVPSASVDDAHTDSDNTLIDDLELDSPRPAQKRLNRTKVLNKPGFLEEDIEQFSKANRWAKEPVEPTARPSKVTVNKKLANFDVDSNNQSGTMEGLSAGEELGLRCVVEKYSDDNSSEGCNSSDQSSYVSAESRHLEQLPNFGGAKKLAMPERLKPPSSILSPDTFNESHASRQTAMPTRQPFMAVSVSDMISNTQDSTAYLNHSQVDSQLSVDSTSSCTKTEQRSFDVKRPQPSPRTPRQMRNISVRTDSLSSYVPSDQENVQQLSQDSDTGDNYSDSFEEDSGDESEVIVKTKSMKDIQVDPMAKMGYTWGF